MLVLQGTLVHSTTTQPLHILQNKIIGVDGKKIAFIHDADKSANFTSNGFSADDIIKLQPHEFLMPGLVDAHIHPPQYVYTGTALDLPLMDWLHKYTFPIEATFADTTWAEEAYRKVVKRVLRNGTTTACYFATIHLEATLKLCDIIEEYGQRGLVGKGCMDKGSPDFYREGTHQSVIDTEKFVTQILGRKNPLLTPVITPRFAPACTSELLSELGRLASKYDLPIQSHIGENREECELVKELFPNCSNYADVYYSHGLLTDKTVMAHGVYLDKSELELFERQGAGIAHCPNSNLSLRSGMLDLRLPRQHNVKVGLGTDVSAGYSPSILDAVRVALHTANVHRIQSPRPHVPALDYKDMFQLATLGGSQVLGLSDKIGNFEVGKEFDALRIDLKSQGSPLDVFDRDTVADCVQKFIYLGDDRNITEVYVAGKNVKTLL